MNPDGLIAIWADFTVSHGEGLGYADESELVHIFEGEGSTVPGRLPRDITLRGLGPFLRVEAALAELSREHRNVLAMHAGVLRVAGRPTKTMKDQAALLGCCQATFRKKLREVRERLQ